MTAVDRHVFAMPRSLSVCAIGIEGWLRSDAIAYQIAYRLGFDFATTARFLAFMFIGVAFSNR